MSINLFHGDCLEVMADMPDNSINAVITDPPYGTTACKWDSIIPFEPMWEQLKRITKDKAAIVLFGSEPFSSVLRVSNIKMFKYDWVWSKPRPSNPQLAKKQVLKVHENISVFYKKLGTYNPQGLEEIPESKRKLHNPENSLLGHCVRKPYIQTHTNYPRSIINFGVERGIHPTQKPVALMEYLIRTYTNEGETVLDFTMGSGTTGVACINTGRNFVGIEKDAEYFKITQERLGL